MTQNPSRTFLLHPGESDDWAVGFSRILKAGELLEGVPTVTVHHRKSPYAQFTGVTITQVQRNTAAVTDSDKVVHEIDQAVEFRIEADGDAEIGEYDVRVKSPTTNGRNPVQPVKLDLRGPPEV